MTKFLETSSTGEWSCLRAAARRRRTSSHGYQTKYKAWRSASIQFEDYLMKRLVVAFCLVLSWYALVSVSSADIIHPAPHRTPHYPPYPTPWRVRPRHSPSVSPAPSTAGPSPSASVSEASPAILGSDVLVAALATGSLLGIVLIRKRKLQE